MTESADGFDAVVVGAGPNGIVAALTLAKAGRRVLLLEAQDRIGGALRSAELTLPGFIHDVGATVLPLALASPAFRSLSPELAGVSWAHPDVPVAHPLDDGAVLLHRDVEQTAADLGRDGNAWRRLVAPVVTGGDRLADALLSPLSASAALRAAGPLTRYCLTGVLPARGLARAAFRGDAAAALFAGLAGHAVLRLSQLSTAGYATFMAGLAHRVGWPVVAGGSQNLVAALESALRRHGVEVQTGVRITDLDELPRAASTILDVSPRQLLDIASDRFSPRYRRGLERFRYGPGVFKIDWALDGPVPWADPAVGKAATVHLGATMREIAAAEREVSLGRHPARPYVICVQPCVADPTRAPQGKHTLWAYCHVPNGSTRDMTEEIEGQLERFAPGFRDRVLARHVLNPQRLEAFDANLIGGDIGGGAADLRQFVARPMLRARPWATPIRGLFLGSASTPPGGGVHGMGGWHAAHLALRG